MNLPRFDTPPDAITLVLDGTLLTTDLKLSLRNIKAMEERLSKNLPVIIATSRPERSIRRLIGGELADRYSLVTLNGAIAKAAVPLVGLVKESLPTPVVESIVDLIVNARPDLEILIELEGHEFGTNHPRQGEELWNINAATPDMVLSLDQAMNREKTKVAFYGFEQDLSAIIEEISQKYGELVSVIPSNTNRFFGIINPLASKIEAIRILLNSRQLSINNVVAIGDDIPDLDMLQACGIPVEMGNAVPELKNVTRYQTASNDEDGVAVVLEKILKGF